MTEAHKNLLFLVACSVGLFLVSLLTRSLIPVDETRYTSVAWEMWLRGDYLVPHLNGATYSHKPLVHVLARQLWPARDVHL
jgi:4-amino-4-deoxy-L-arabinose transferase-like glycosyltransferase